MKFVKVIKVAYSSIIVLIMFFFNLNPIGLVEQCFSQNLILKLQNQQLRMTINTAIVILIVQILVNALDKPILLNIRLKNFEGIPVTYLPISDSKLKSKKLNLDIEINYKKNIYKKIINRLGELCIYVQNTRWTTIQMVKDTDESLDQAIDDHGTKEYIVISINRFLSISEVDKNLRINMDIMSNAPLKRIDGTISVDLGFKDSNKLKKILLKLLVDYKTCTHKIQSIER